MSTSGFIVLFVLFVSAAVLISADYAASLGGKSAFSFVARAFSLVQKLTRRISNLEIQR